MLPQTPGQFIDATSSVPICGYPCLNPSLSAMPPQALRKEKINTYAHGYPQINTDISRLKAGTRISGRILQAR
jgi:hypothetical protein